MKGLRMVLFGAVGLIVAAVAVLFVMSLRSNAGHTSASVEIEAPADSVFAWVTEPVYVKRWVSWLVEVRQDTVTANGVGSRETWFMDDPNMKQRVEVKSEVLRYERPRRVDVKVWMDGGFSGTYAYELEPAGTGTRITMSGSSRYDAWFARLLEPLVTPQALQKMNADFARLKQLVEAATD